MTALPCKIPVSGICAMLFVAGAPARSGDPQTFTAGSSCAKIARGTHVFVQVSHGGSLLTSTDRAAWTEQRVPIQTFFRGITFDRGLFVAVGGSYTDVPGVIMTSPDGTNWTRRNPRNKSSLHTIVCGNNLFVTAGDAGAIFSSRDGICWKMRPSGTTAMLATIAFGNGVFVAGGESGTIVTSTNGVDWVGQTLQPPVYVGRIRFRDGCFLAGDADTTFVSSDGRIWHQREMLPARAQ